MSNPEPNFADYRQVIKQCNLCPQQQKYVKDGGDENNKLVCGDPLLVTAKSNVWCHILKFKDVNLKALCKLSKYIPILYPWDNDYSTLRMEYNKRVNFFPSAIVMAEKRSHIRRSLDWAKKHKVPISVRSGGHSFEGFSMTTGLVIDISKMNAVKVDQEASTVEIEAGAIIGPTLLEVQKYGLIFPTGTCPNVGIAGLTLGGGVGFLDRKWGLTCDNLEQVEMILANGETMTVNEKRNSDLFWACRGAGGGNFGIVTRFWFKTHELASVVLFEYDYPWSKAAEAVSLWQEWAPSTDRSLACELILNGPQRGISFSGQWEGRTSALKKKLSVLNSLGEPSKVKIWRSSVLDAARFHADRNSRPPYQKVKSSICYTNLSKEGIAALIKHTSEIKDTETDGKSDRIGLNALGGAISDVGKDQTAFLHRDARFWIEYATYWNDPNDAPFKLEWIQTTHAAMKPYVSEYAYVNFVDLSIQDWKHAYWGSHYPRLVEIKRKYDPEDLFHMPQGIRLEEESSFASSSPVAESVWTTATWISSAHAKNALAISSASPPSLPSSPSSSSSSSSSSEEETKVLPSICTTNKPKNSDRKPVRFY